MRCCRGPFWQGCLRAWCVAAMPDQPPFAFPGHCVDPSVPVTMAERSLSPGYRDSDKALVVVGTVSPDSWDLHQP